MIFSVNDRIVYYNSGIEHAEFKRTRLFHRYHQPTKILLDYWDLLTHYYLRKLKIPSNNVINMYDYFQHAEAVKFRPFQITDFELRHPGTVKNNGSYQEIQQGDDLYDVYFFNQSGYRNQIKKVNYFHHNNCDYTDYYDVRGFLTRRMYYRDGHESQDLFYSPSGKVEIKEVLYKESHNQQYYSKYYVWGAKEPIYTRANLILHFFNLLCLQNESLTNPVIFISDRWWRNRLVGRILSKIKYPHYLAYYAHYSHTYNDKKAMTAQTYSRFADIFKQAKATSPKHSYDAVICSTRRQAHDIKRRYHLNRKLFVIPVGIQDVRHHPKLKFKKRWPDQITCVTRVSPVEGVLDTVRAFGLAKRKLPNLKLVIYGKMGPLSNKFRNKLNAIEQKYSFGDASISIRDYTQNVLDVYSKSRLTLVTAPNDAFNISLLEALSQGCPAVVYTNNYGPRDMIKDGYNGYKVDNDYRQMAKRIVHLFKHPHLMKRMSKHAYKSSFQFSSSQVWKQYQKLIHQAEREWPNKLI